MSQVQISESQIADLAASFQQAVVDVLVAKSVQATLATFDNRQPHLKKRLCVGGGVAANQLFRLQLAESCEQHEIDLLIAPRKYCTDNAVMGAIAVERMKSGLVEPLDLDIKPGLLRF